jgi:hypothetical protein
MAEVLLQAVIAGWRGLTAAFAALGLVSPVPARVRELWREAARASGLGAVEETEEDLAGWVGPLRVRLSRYRTQEVSGTRISIRGPSLPADVTVRPEGFGASIRGLDVREIEIGDEGFDRAAWVEGPPALVRSLLDAETRRSIRGLFEGRLERPRHSPFWATGRFDDGVLRIDVPEEFPRRRARGLFDGSGDAGEEPGESSYLGGTERLPEVLRRSIAVANSLTVPDDVARRITDDLGSEPVARVRMLNLLTLTREFPQHPATREALLAAREDPDAEVRLRAGIALGPEGRDVLLAVARGEGAEDATTARAVVALEPHLSLQQAQGLLHDALRTRRVATAGACMDELGRRGAREAIPALAKVLLVETGELARTAARALATTGDPAAEAPLLRALAKGPRDLRLAAATALGRVGTTAAVLPLREVESADSGTRRAARQAIAEIQARAAGAAPGQLSLAGGESGRLSLAGGESGRLSLAGGEGRPAPALSSRGASSVSGEEGSAIPADPSGPGPQGSLGMTPADPSGPGPRGSRGMTSRRKSVRTTGGRE